MIERAYRALKAAFAKPSSFMPTPDHHKTQLSLYELEGCMEVCDYFRHLKSGQQKRFKNHFFAMAADFEQRVFGNHDSNRLFHPAIFERWIKASVDHIQRGPCLGPDSETITVNISEEWQEISTQIMKYDGVWAKREFDNEDYPRLDAA